jgi:hypothetical protein
VQRAPKASRSPGRSRRSARLPGAFDIFLTANVCSGYVRIPLQRAGPNDAKPKLRHDRRYRESSPPRRRRVPLYGRRRLDDPADNPSTRRVGIPRGLAARVDRGTTKADTSCRSRSDRAFACHSGRTTPSASMVVDRSRRTRALRDCALRGERGSSLQAYTRSCEGGGRENRHSLDEPASACYCFSELSGKAALAPLPA